MNSALLTLYRSLTRHRLYAVLNIGGLALGLAVFIVLMLFVRFETSFDKVLPGWDKIWVLQERYALPGAPVEPEQYSMGNELVQLKGEFPQLAGTRFYSADATVRQGPESTAETLAAVDPNFFALFPYRVIAGDPAAALHDPDGLILTQRAAARYFGGQRALGRNLTIAIDGQDYAYRVGAVIADPPPQTTYSSDLYAVIVPARFANEWWDHWGSASLTTFLRFPDAAAARAFDAALPGFLDRHAFPPGELKKGDYLQNVVPLPALHLAAPSDRAIVATLAIVGALTLLIALVNYVNLATARAGLRAREVALRKVLGGTRASIIAQFLGEAVAIAAIAALIGLALAEAALPQVNAAGGTALSIDYVGRNGVLIPLAITVILVGLLAGTYPALVLSGFRPAGVLASARAPGGGKAGARVRRGLVVIQFAIAIAFAIGTAVMFAQVAHLRTADLGFRRDGLLVVRSFPYGALDQGTKDDLLRAFRTTPGVVDASVGQYAPGDQMTTNSENYWLPGTPTAKHSLMTIPIAPDYFQTYGAHLLAGRLPTVRYGSDDLAGWKQTTAAPLDIVVNQAALADLGISSPEAAIGQVLADPRAFRIVGVVADLHFLSPREPVRGTLYMLDTRRISSGIAVVRYAGVDAATITARLEAAWKRVVPTVPFDARTVEQNLWENYYQLDARRARLFTIGAVLAVLIGCIGLYGLASFDTARRVKEIGIRKTLGASTRDIMRLLIGQFLRPVLLANLIAWPIAFFAMRQWLSGFDDRVALSPLYFLAASLVAIAIAAATVFGQAWRVARAEPARALRYE